jgi:hypothetical protein
MSLQYLIDNAASIGIDRKPVVAQTISRDGTVRSVSRGGAVWQFDIRLPDGPPWQLAREIITEVENFGRITPDTVQFSALNLAWLFGYMGTQANPSTVTVSIPGGAVYDQLNITGGVSITSGVLFSAGDIIQMTDGTNTGKVYTVREEVAWNDTIIKLHRPFVNEPTYSGTINLNVGGDCEFRVICVQYPQFNIFSRDQISWDGSFVLQEVIT